MTPGHLEQDNSTKSNDLRQRPTWNQLEAVKLGRVVVTSDEMTRPAPGLVEAIVTLAHRLHPEVFRDTEQNSKNEKAGQGPQAAEVDSGPGVLCAL
jgi:hypothetical protein